jgi:hypothetical protein
MIRVNKNGVEYGADHARIAVRRNAHARREAHVDGELRRIFAGDEQAALFNKFFEVREAVVAQAGPHVRSGVDAAEVRREVRLLPRHWRCSTGAARRGFL